MAKIQPRKKYSFAKMEPGDSIRIPVPESDPLAGKRALCAAYAYGKRNDKQFFGKHVTTPKRGAVMVIGREK